MGGKIQFKDDEAMTKINIRKLRMLLPLWVWTYDRSSMTYCGTLGTRKVTVFTCSVLSGPAEDDCELVVYAEENGIRQKLSAFWIANQNGSLRSLWDPQAPKNKRPPLPDIKVDPTVTAEQLREVAENARKRAEKTYLRKPRRLPDYVIGGYDNRKSR